MAETLTALSQRNEAFWIGLALFLSGVIAPEVLSLGGVELSNTLILIGGGILLIRVLVGSMRILKTTAKAGATGYRDGRDTDA